MNRMAQMELLPRFFVRLNRHGAPTACLVTTGIMIQVLSVVMLFSEAAYQFAYSLCTASIVISWGLAAAYMVKLSWPRRREGAGRAFALSLFATVFLTVAILLAGIDLLMLCCIAYVPGIVFFVMARREHGAGSVMRRWEMALAAALLVIAVVSAVMVATGAITI